MIDIQIEMNKKIGTERSKDSILEEMQRLGIRAGKSSRWTEKEIDLLQELIKAHGHTKTAARQFIEQTGTNRTVSAVMSKANVVASSSGRDAWTEEDDILLRAVFKQHDKWGATVSAFQSASGRDVTLESLKKRAKALGLQLSTKKEKALDK